VAQDQPTNAKREIRIELHETAGLSRHKEPVTIGVPWPRGEALENRFALFDEDDIEIPLQSEVLQRWPDGNPQWVLCDWQVDLEPYGKKILKLSSCRERQEDHTGEFEVKELEGGWRIDSDCYEVRLPQDRLRLEFESKRVPGCKSHLELSLTEEKGTVQCARVTKWVWEARGPLRLSLRVEAEFRAVDNTLLGQAIVRIHFFAGLSVLRMEVTLRNPRAARHPGGLWDLGDAGSLYFGDLSLCWRENENSAPQVAWTESPSGDVFRSQCPVKIYQDSSGGDNWDSRNHVNCRGQISTRFRGYRVSAPNCEGHDGLRAAPVVLLEGDQLSMGVAVKEFWQNFPKTIEVDSGLVRIGLFPHESNDLFELQGGEQKTHTVFIDLSAGEQALKSLAAMAHDALIPVVNPTSFVESGALPYLSTDENTEDPERRRMLTTIVEDEKSFRKRREIIDEYGWRNFGELYADHESAERKDGLPTISHYNNQYDVLQGFIYQWAACGDPRWFRMMDELARHVIDIDIYHTQQDKPKSNGGLFWHTDHYCDAETATHRSYSRRNARGLGRSYGGGLSNEHNYTTGLMYFYYLTGNPLAREAVIGLADWVIAADDGRRSRFGWLDKRDTGLASSTVSRFYHGPGRGSANSISALLDGYTLTGADRYVQKAESLIRRCIHPRDDVDGRDLLNLEDRWSYLVFLQVLGRYLDYKKLTPGQDEMFGYARLSLLRYVDWMLEHEVPYTSLLNKVKKPTETWPAHDIRKADVFCVAANYADSEEKRSQFLRKASYFYQTCLEDLKRFPSWTLTRPLVILLTNGWVYSSKARIRMEPLEPLPESSHLSLPMPFRPQLHGILKLRWLLQRLIHQLL